MYMDEQLQMLILSMEYPFPGKYLVMVMKLTGASMRVVATTIWDSDEKPSFRCLRSGGIPSSSTIVFLSRSLSPAKDASELAASTRSLNCVECWTVAMLDHTQAVSTGSLRAMGGRKRFTPALSSGETRVFL
ncbi:hypothetical protein L2E82_27346 [Cichorium intybus]|uniref:Uncharacterized protein n=1 Tax=Cichorium intybus TaxID=13427 RepID=A0ACB9CSM7_CICIN|nr:hypothetical protein L2E82_27346 [Cichorium intybus]